MDDYYGNILFHDESEYALIAPDGAIRFYKGRRLHREDGPAVIYSSGDTSWYIDDLPHRIGYPAYENYDDDTNFDGRTGWYVRGQCVNIPVRNYADSVGIDLSKISDYDRVMLTIFMSGL